MSLRRKSLLYLALLCSLLIALVYIHSHYVLFKDVRNYETIALDRNDLRLTEALDRDLQDLARTVQDYAYWDDTLQFMSTGDEQFILDNFVPESLDALGVNLVIVLDLAGNVVYSYSSGALANTNADLVRSQLPLRPFASKVLLVDVPALASLSEIRDTSGEELPGGYLLMAYGISEDYIALFSKVFGYPVSLVPAGGPADRFLSPNSVTSVAPMFNSWGGEVFALQYEWPREVLVATETTMRRLLYGLVGIAFVTLSVLDWLLRRHLFSRLDTLASVVTKIQDSSSLVTSGDRPKVDDEITQLSGAVSDMLARLEGARQRVVASETLFRLLFDSIPEAMVLRDYVVDSIGNADTYRVIDMNPAYASLQGVVRDEALNRLREDAFGDYAGSDWIAPLLPEVLGGNVCSLIRYDERTGKHLEVTAHGFGGNRVAVRFADISKQVEAREQLERKSDSMSRLVEVTERLLGTSPAGSSEERICEAALALFKASAVLFCVESAGDGKMLVRSVAASTQLLEMGETIIGKDVLGSVWEWDRPRGRDAGYQVSHTMRLSDITGDSVPQADMLQESLGLSSFLLLELIHEGKLLGSLLVCLDHAVEDAYASVALIFGRIASSAILREREETARKETEVRYQDLLNTAPLAILVTDVEGNIIIANEQAATLHGYETGESMVGVNTIYLVHEEDRQTVRQQMVERMDGRVQRQLERRLMRMDGSHFPADVTARAIMTESVLPLGQLIMYQDITPRKQAEDKLVYLSLHDQLTGLYNRAYFDAELQRLQDGRLFPVSILSVDVNGLKLINDTFGHAMGDALLRAAALVLKQALRKSDTLSRVGGDEFALSLPNADATVAESVIARIREAVKQHNAGALCAQCDESTWIPLSLSLGAATAQDDSVSLEDLFGQADNRMYQDKQAQGNEYMDLLAQAVEDGRFEARVGDITDRSGDRVSREQLIAILKDRGRH